MEVTKNEILEYLKFEKRQFFKAFNLTKIGLFGSYASESASADSDIDIIVEFEENTQQLHQKKNELRRLISGKFGKRVDICREKYIKPYYKGIILENAVFV